MVGICPKTCCSLFRSLGSACNTKRASPALLLTQNFLFKRGTMTLWLETEPGVWLQFLALLYVTLGGPPLFICSTGIRLLPSSWACSAHPAPGAGVERCP